MLTLLLSYLDIYTCMYLLSPWAGDLWEIKGERKGKFDGKFMMFKMGFGMPGVMVSALFTIIARSPSDH